MQLQETQAVKALLTESKRLLTKYNSYVAPLKEAHERRYKKPVDEMTLATILRCLENFDLDIRGMSEATKAANVGTFIQHGYDLITAVYPNLVLNNLASIQPLNSRSGDVWFYNIVYNATKGGVTDGDSALDAKTGLRANKYYSSEFIPVTVTGAINGVNDTFTATLPAFANVKQTYQDKGIIVTDGIEVFTWSGLNATNSVLTGSAGGAGTYNGTTGAVSVVFNTAPATGSTVLTLYRADFEASPSLIGKAKISLVSEPISAEKHALITDYSLDAEYDLARNFNMPISDELIKGTAALIRAEIDQLGMDDIKRAATRPDLSASASNTWTGTVPAGIAQIDHFRTLITMWRKQSNDIFDATRMVHGNVAIVGKNIATVVETLPEFRPAVDVQTSAQNAGPYVSGMIGGFLVIKNPEFSANEWVIGNKGVGVFNTGYVLAPYRGLMVTPPISDVNNPFSITRGMYLEAGRKVVNGKFYSYGVGSSISF